MSKPIFWENNKNVKMSSAAMITQQAKRFGLMAYLEL